jgi:hypothetical protein
MILGHGYPKSPGFGVAPCPATIFTFGILLMIDKKFPKYILIIPLIWLVIGFFAAINLGIKEDIGLLLSGIITAILILFRKQAEITRV